MSRAILIIFIISTTISSVGYALEVGEKLTIRLLKVSDSKRTVLLNRGLEDGVVVGDHAKLFLTTGVIARAIVVKASPSRSIWSIYRKVVPPRLVAGEVMNIMITDPAKITEDSSKSLSEDIELPKDVIVVDGANDLPETLNIQEQNQLDEISEVPPPSSVRKRDAYGKNILLPRSNFSIDQLWALYGMLYFSHLSSEVSSETTTNIGAIQQIDLSLGVERYFQTQTEWYRDTSLFVEVSKLSGQQLSLGGMLVEQSATEFGLGGAWHFYNHIFARERLIGFTKLGFGLGSYNDTYSSSSLSSATTYQGSGNYFSLGVGTKYYSRYNYGVRLELEYFARSESFIMDDGSNYVRSSGGPRVRLGAIYRF
jgi:hypothetical protein